MPWTCGCMGGLKVSNVAQFNTYLLAVVKYFSEVTLFTRIMISMFMQCTVESIFPSTISFHIPVQ